MKTLLNLESLKFENINIWFYRDNGYITITNTDM